MLWVSFPAMFEPVYIFLNFTNKFFLSIPLLIYLYRSQRVRYSGKLDFQKSCIMNIFVIDSSNLINPLLVNNCIYSHHFTSFNSRQI